MGGAWVLNDRLQDSNGHRSIPSHILVDKGDTPSDDTGEGSERGGDKWAGLSRVPGTLGGVSVGVVRKVPALWSYRNYRRWWS